MVTRADYLRSVLPRMQPRDGCVHPNARRVVNPVRFAEFCPDCRAVRQMDGR